MKKSEKKYHLIRILVVTGLLSSLFMGAGSPCQGQDVIYSQFYANPINMNPALTGTSEFSRFSASYRKYFTDFSPDFYSATASFDTYSQNLHGGWGGIISRNNYAYFSQSMVGLVYSYHFNISEDIIASTALGTYINQYTIDWNELKFGDQVDPIDGFVKPTGESVPSAKNDYFPDFSYGVMFFWKKKYNFGLAVHHLNQPVYNFYENINNKVHRKFTFNFSYKINHNYGRDNQIVVYPNLIFQKQNESNYLNIGNYFYINNLVIGGWYRHEFDNSNNSVVLLAGIKYGKFKFGYSYDSSFSNIEALSNNSHEITFEIQFGKSNHPEPINYECPMY